MDDMKFVNLWCQCIREMICDIIGHSDVAIQTGHNERATWGWFHCSRCNRDEAYQYDEPN